MALGPRFVAELDILEDSAWESASAETSLFEAGG
jgi:hypothetical protein